MAANREIKIGIFVTGLLLLLALAIIFIGNIGDLFKKQGYEVYALFDSALGLENKASVKLGLGIKIGEVKDITLSGRRAKVGMMIYPEHQIPRGSRANAVFSRYSGRKICGDRSWPGRDLLSERRSYGIAASYQF